MSTSQRKSYSHPVRQPRLHPAHLGGGGRSHPELPHRRQTSTVQGTEPHAATSAATVSVTECVLFWSTCPSSLCRRTSCSPEDPPCSETLAGGCRET